MAKYVNLSRDSSGYAGTTGDPYSWTDLYTAINDSTLGVGDTYYLKGRVYVAGSWPINYFPINQNAYADSTFRAWDSTCADSTYTWLLDTDTDIDLEGHWIQGQIESLNGYTCFNPKTTFSSVTILGTYNYFTIYSGANFFGCNVLTGFIDISDSSTCTIKAVDSVISFLNKNYGYGGYNHQGGAVINLELINCCSNSDKTSIQAGVNLTDTSSQFSWVPPVSWPSVSDNSNQWRPDDLNGTSINTPPEPGNPPYIDSTYGAYDRDPWGVSRLRIGSWLSVPVKPVLSSSTAGDTTVTVSWSTVYGATSYDLYYKDGTSVTKVDGTKITGVSSPKNVTGLLNDTTYSFAVTALSSSEESVLSDSTQIIPKIPTPVAPTISSVTILDTTATVSWGNVSGASSYNLYHKDGTSVTKIDSTKITGAISPQDVTGLSKGTQYAFATSAQNSSGESDLSNTETTTFPPIISATVGSTKVTVTWNTVIGSTSYNLYYRAGNSVTKLNGTKITGVTSPREVTGLTNGTEYAFAVSVVMPLSGESDLSNTEVKTPAAGWAYKEIKPAGDINVTWYNSDISDDGKRFIVASDAGGLGNGRIYYSSDTGNSWTEYRPTGLDQDFGWWPVRMSDNGACIAAAEGGVNLYYSSNSGSDWTTLNPDGLGNPISYVTMSSDGLKLCVSQDTKNWHSSNSGADWTDITPPAGVSNWLDISDDGLKIYAIVGPRQWYSSNSGTFWTEVQPLGDFNYSTSFLRISGDGLKLFCNINNLLMYSANTGATWTEFTPGGYTAPNNWTEGSISYDGSVLCVFAANDVSTMGRIFYSTNSGSTWAELTPAGDVDAPWWTGAMATTGNTFIAGQYPGRLYYGSRASSSNPNSLVPPPQRDGTPVTSLIDSFALVTITDADPYFDNINKFERIDIFYADSSSREKKVVTHFWNGTQFSGQAAWSTTARDGTWQRSGAQCRDHDGAITYLTREQLGLEGDIFLA